MVTIASTGVQHVTIDDAGHWLAPAAAASYQAMLAAGMPAGGINSAGRSNSEQQQLYAQKGPSIAAKPGTSPHEAGIALDMSTTSRAHKWLLSNGAANGWTRPMSYEPWHWQYGDAVATASSTPVAGAANAVKNVAGDVVAGVANFLGFGDIGSQVFTIVITGAFVIAGLGLGVIGLTRMLTPTIGNALGGAA